MLEPSNTSEWNQNIFYSHMHNFNFVFIRVERKTVTVLHSKHISSDPFALRSKINWSETHFSNGPHNKISCHLILIFEIDLSDS